jgi:hypothetical protein
MLILSKKYFPNREFVGLMLTVDHRKDVYRWTLYFFPGGSARRSSNTFATSAGGAFAMR